MSRLKKYSAVILSAGRSLRMGRPKMMLPFDDSRTFLDVITERYSHFGCREIVLVVNAENSPLANSVVAKKRVSVAVNTHPEWQRFYSVQVGLKAMKEENPVFIHNIDNPFVDGELLQKMGAVLPVKGYVVPVFQGRGGHPVLLSAEVARQIVASPDPFVNLKMFLKSFGRVEVESENDNVLVNINTMQEYLKFKEQKELR